MAGGARELIDGVAVPMEVEPAHAVENRVDRRLGRTGAIGILDTEQEPATMVAREQPVEQRGTRATDMEEAGRRGGEARYDGGTGRFGRSGRVFGRSEEPTSELPLLMRISYAVYCLIK